MRTRFFGAVVMVMTAVIAMVGCQKDPSANEDTIKVYAEELTALPEGEELRFNYTITEPKDGLTLSVECSAEWVSGISVKASFVDLVVAKNDSGKKRTATLELGYGNSRKSLNIIQEPWLEPLSLKVNNIDATSVTISVTTLDEETTWIGQIVGKEWFEAYTEEQIFTEDLAYYHSMASEAEVSIEEYLAAILSRGSRSGIRMGGLDIESEYVVYIYGMNTLGEKTTSIYYEAFTTTPAYEGNDVTFDFEISVNRSIASITVRPSHEGVAYYHNLSTREHFDAFGGDIEALAKDVVATALDNYLYWEYTEAEFFEYNSYYLTDFYDFEGIANTEYVAFAFKWDENLEPLSEISYEWFKIDAIPPSENKLEMTISNVTQTTFDIAVEATNEDPYTIFAVEKKELAKLSTDGAIFKYLMDTYGTSQLSLNVCNGPIAGTFSGLEQDTEYVVLLFGYEAGTLTTPIVREDIKTAKAGDVEACQYNVEITEIADRSAHIKISPSDYSIWYYWNVFEASTTEEEIKEYINEVYNSYYYADYWEFSYYELTQGVSDSYLSQLHPSTDYKVVVVPMDENEYLYTGSMRIVGEFTTKEAVVADITITAGFDAYYDGDEVSALEPDYLSNYQGYAILPMSVSIEGEYSRFLYTIFNYVEGLENPAIYSDDVLLDTLYEVGAYWTPAYFRGEWDKDLMIAAVAFDMEGNPSPIYRHKFILTREGAGDAQEFVDYYMGSISSVKSVGVKSNAYIATSDAPKIELRTKSEGSSRGVKFVKM